MGLGFGVGMIGLIGISCFLGGYVVIIEGFGDEYDFLCIEYVLYVG